MTPAKPRAQAVRNDHVGRAIMHGFRQATLGVILLAVAVGASPAFAFDIHVEPDNFPIGTVITNS